MSSDSSIAGIPPAGEGTDRGEYAEAPRGCPAAPRPGAGRQRPPRQGERMTTPTADRDDGDENPRRLAALIKGDEPDDEPDELEDGRADARRIYRRMGRRP